MKSRVKIDSSIVHFFVFLTGFLYLFPFLYVQEPFVESTMDFLGILTILKGALLRMSARAYKKFRSAQGHALVMTGPYLLVRNPMYLGSFLMGAGFVLLVWPWWSLPIFCVLFLMRFMRQVKKEEEHLTKLFGADYEDYCRRVPRMFPNWEVLRRINIHESFPMIGLFSTKEKWGLLGWPLAAIILESFQEKLVFGYADVPRIVSGFLFATFVFAVGVCCVYLVAADHYAQNPE